VRVAHDSLIVQIAVPDKAVEIAGWNVFYGENEVVRQALTHLTTADMIQSLTHSS
jgi:hypothetical protein